MIWDVPGCRGRCAYVFKFFLYCRKEEIAKDCCLFYRISLQIISLSWRHQIGPVGSVWSHSPFYVFFRTHYGASLCDSPLKEKAWRFGQNWAKLLSEGSQQIRKTLMRPPPSSRFTSSQLFHRVHVINCRTTRTAVTSVQCVFLLRLSAAKFNKNPLWRCSYLRLSHTVNTAQLNFPPSLMWRGSGSATCRVGAVTGQRRQEAKWVPELWDIWSSREAKL